MDDSPRRSRTAWPGPMSIAGVEPGHDHQLPAPLLQRIRLLTIAVVIFGVCFAAIAALIVAWVLLRSDYRDREAAREEQRINEKFCEFLALAPADSPLADEMRGELGCTQPGRAMEDLPPAVQDRLANRPGMSEPPSATPAPPAATASRPRPSPGPTPPRPAGNPPAPATPGPTSPPDPPLVDLDPITKPLCDALGVCL